MENKNTVLLIYPAPDVIKPCRFGYSLLLLYIASDLNNHGYNVRIFDYSFNLFSDSDLHKQLQSTIAVIVEIDAFPLKRSTNTDNAKQIISNIRDYDNNIPIIAIGKQCTLNNKPIPFADITITGDSEIVISPILSSIISHKHVPSLYNAGHISNLSLLSSPAYHLLNSEQIRGKTSTFHMHLAPSALLETSRGCPGKCSFCQRKGWEERILMFPIESIQSNYSCLLSSGIKNIWITDENFCGNLEHAKSVLKSFIEVQKKLAVLNTKICLSSWVHIDSSFLDLAKLAGVSIISFGIESVTYENQLFYHKLFNPDKLNLLLEYANNIGLFTVGNFIIGSPYDTQETILQNIDFAIQSKLDLINVKTLDYMIGSELYDNLPLEKKNDIHFFSCFENGTAKLSRQEIKQLVCLFQKEFEEHHKEQLKRKISQWGPPYWSEKNV